MNRRLEQHRLLVSESRSEVGAEAKEETQFFLEITKKAEGSKRDTLMSLLGHQKAKESGKCSSLYHRLALRTNLCLSSSKIQLTN